jgi:hypothetical protein
MRGGGKIARTVVVIRLQGRGRQLTRVEGIGKHLLREKATETRLRSREGGAEAGAEAESGRVKQTGEGREARTREQRRVWRGVAKGEEREEGREAVVTPQTPPPLAKAKHARRVGRGQEREAIETEAREAQRRGRTEVVREVQREALRPLAPLVNPL